VQPPHDLSFLTWNGQDRDFFWFEDGVVIGWGMTQADRQSLVKLLALQKSEEAEEESLNFEFGEVAHVDRKRDTIILTKNNEWLEKVTYSIGLVRSVKLDQIEIEVDNVHQKILKLDFGRTKPRSGEATHPRSELAYLYNLSYDLTVKSKVLEAPNFLWDKPASLHTIYTNISQHLDIEARVRVAQEKMKLPENYWQLENDAATASIGWRLEKMIIILILIEVIFQILGKSETWESWSWEKGFRHLMGLPEPKPKIKIETTREEDDRYQIVEEIYEIIEPKPTRLYK